MADESLAALLERWMAGDPAAGEEIYKRYYSRAWLFAISLTGREADADDIAQEALMCGLEGIKGGKRPDKFTGWILGIARHAALREGRRRGREELDPMPQPAAGSAGPPTQLVREEMDGVLRRVLAELSPEERTMLELRLKCRLPREEAAARLGRTVKTMDRLVREMAARLREALSRHFTTLVLSSHPERLTLGHVERLRPSFRRAFELRHLEELPVAQAAERLGVPEKTVLARLRHAYDELGCGEDEDFGPLREAYQRKKESAGRERGRA